MAYVWLLIDQVSNMSAATRQMSVFSAEVVIATADSQHVRGAGKLENRLVILLEPDKVLSDREVDSLKKLEKRSKQSEKAT